MPRDDVEIRKPWDGLDKRIPWDGVERRRPRDSVDRSLFQVPTIPGNYPGNFINLIRSCKTNSTNETFIPDIHKPKEERGIVLALDIRNFTKTMKDNDHYHVQSFLSTFFNTAVDKIQNNHGSYVNKFLGDGLLAHFPEKLADVAINVAEDLIRIFTGLREGYYFKFCNLSVSLSKTEHIEATVGKENYIDYTLLGSEINSLFRLLSSTEGRLVYVSNNYISSLNKSHWYVFVGTKYFKGIIEPVACYSVIRQRTDEEITSNIAQECNKSICPTLYDNCYKAWYAGHEMMNLDTQAKYIFALDCHSCATNNKCWYWSKCPVKFTNAKNQQPTECCHICSNFRNCFHSYQLGRQGAGMITCNSILRELS